jgi:hypothetical protein
MRHWRGWAFVALALWVVAVTVWALNPITATVHVGLNADGSEQTVTVECDSPLSGNSSPTSALPVLQPGQSFAHDDPCSSPVTSGRTIYIIDILVGAAALVLLVASRGRLDQRPEPSVSAAAALT